MKHLFIDLETFGQTPGCSVFQIGAACFDLETGEIGAGIELNIDPIHHGYIDPPTVAWHREKGTYPMPGNTVAHHPKAALEEFAEWFTLQGGITSVWSWGAAFDFPVLEDLWRWCFGKKEMPWPYYEELCARTVWKLAFPDERHQPRPHKALEDCHAAIRDLVKANRALRGKEGQPS